MSDDGDDELRSRRGLFAHDVDSYEAGRPHYPERVYELLATRAGLARGTRIVEIGPGSGQVTARLLDLGASVVAVELGAAFVDRLRLKFAGRPLEVVHGAFERVALAPASADLVVAATAFHWIPADAGLDRAAAVLRPGGSLALWWTVFGDSTRPDPFHDALLPVLARVAPEVVEPADAATPHALDVPARVGEIAATGRFDAVEHELIRWVGRHTSDELRALFASFSPWLALPPPRRAAALDALEALARDEFGGIVERPYVTAVYWARRR